MKYNISNLDKFISNFDATTRINTEPSEALINSILNDRTNMIEDKIKELLNPYIDIENNDVDFMIPLLNRFGYELNSIFYPDYEEYNIANIFTKEKDYFTVRWSSIKEKDGAYSTDICISEIMRGIKQ